MSLRSSRSARRTSKDADQRDVGNCAHTCMPRPAAAWRLSLPASCARAAAAVTAGKSRRRAPSPRAVTALATFRSAASQARTAVASPDGGFSASSCLSAASYSGSVFATYRSICVYERGCRIAFVCAAYAEQTASACLTKSECERRPSPHPASPIRTARAQALRPAPENGGRRVSRRQAVRRRERRTAPTVLLRSPRRILAPSTRPRDSQPDGRTRFRRGNRRFRRSSARAYFSWASQTGLSIRR